MVYGGLLLAMFFWGLSFIGTKFCLNNSLQPISIVLIRLILSSAFLLVLGYFFHHLVKIKREHIKWFVLLAFFEPFLYFIGETYGLTLVSATIASIIISTIPLFVPFMAWLIFKEKVSFFNISGIVISIMGVSLTMLNGNLEFVVSSKGLLLMLLAVVSALGYTMVLRRLANEYSALTIITYQNLLGIPFFIPLFFLLDFSQFSFSVFTSDLWLVLLLMSLFPSSLSYMFYTYSISKIGMSKTSVFTNLIPIITALASFVLFNEVMTLVKIIGIFIVIFGLLLSQYGKKET